MEAKELERLLEEMGSNTVSKIYFSEERGRWIIEYNRPDFPPDYFLYFTDVMDFLENG